MSDNTPVLLMEGVAKSYLSPKGPVEVLRCVDLRIDPGEFVVVTGPSGSGKSTLLNLAALLDKPSSGKLTFAGRDVSALSEAEMCRVRGGEIGMVFQRFCLLPHRTALDNVLFRWRYAGHDGTCSRERAEQALADVELREVRDRPARLLSAGEMQRVAIARTLVLPPRLLVADEPTGNLDSVSTSAVMSCFAKLNREGITIMMVTHNERLVGGSSRHFVCRNGTLEKATPERAVPSATQPAQVPTEAAP